MRGRGGGKRENKGRWEEGGAEGRGRDGENGKKEGEEEKGQVIYSQRSNWQLIPPQTFLSHPPPTRV